MAWRVARSLDTLLGQLNLMYPHRSKVSDGSIGDAAHASRSSDHNPWYRSIVTARDFTHDPQGGIDCHKLAQWLTTSGDRRIKYVIWNRRIWQGGWKAYYGANPHTSHLHLSVVGAPACDSTTAWRLGGAIGRIVATLKRGMRGAAVRRMQGLLRTRLRTRVNNLTSDGIFGAITEHAVRLFGQQAGIPGGNGGEYGGRTKAALDPPFLKRGASGAPVRYLQGLLNQKLNHPPGVTVDGQFGPKTASAVCRFQDEERLGFKGTQWYGQVGPATWTRLIKTAN